MAGEWGGLSNVSRREVISTTDLLLNISSPPRPGELFPTGEGLFAFISIEGAANAIGCIESDHRRYSVTARKMAAEHFDCSRVLKRLIETALRCRKLGAA